MVLTLLLCFFASLSFAQRLVKGKVSTAADGTELPGVTVLIKGTTTGVSTDLNGDFQISIEDDAAMLVFRFVGYLTKEVPVSSKSYFNISLEADNRQLEEVVVVGSRFNPRSVISSPVPIDNIAIDELADAGHIEIDQMITYKVPSFNSTQQTVSDATAHMNPADLRGLGPSRTLVLINGKRKNASSLVYINDTPGKGEVGVDLKSIPTSAIERIEVLRDGAAATYGSDAIAGVINIILKRNVNEGSVTMNSGVTTEGDGFQYGVDANYGFGIGERGFMNVSVGYADQRHTNRAGSPGKDELFDVGADNPWIQANPSLGMVVGQPDMIKGDAYFNMMIPFAGGGEVYANGGVTNRRGKSFALYRTPYWIADSPHGPEGFLPTFENDINDNNLTVGVRGKKGDWNIDMSSTFGSNSMDYTIGDTYNTDLGEASPTSFYAGGYDFSQLVNNLDISRDFGMLRLGLGGEFRMENFGVRAGEEASYFGSGAQSFPGLQPSNELNKKRYNVGLYVDGELDLTKAWLLGATARVENYSDFGSNLSWKLNTRYALLDGKLNIRGAISTGFRAPSLHQIYLSNIQTLVSGGTISNQGTFNNQSPAVRAIGVPELKEELSFNYSFGMSSRLTDQLTLTADYYNISVDNRVVFSGEVNGGDDPNSKINQILAAYDITSMKFFTNAVNTQTQGVDIIASYNNLAIGRGNLNLNLAANFNETKIVGELGTPQALKDAGNDDWFNRKEQGRLTSARPQSKIVVGTSYKIGIWGFTLNNTRFGKVSWQHATDPEKDQTFSAKWVTDLNISAQISDNFSMAVGANNLFNVYPDEIDTKGDPVTDLGGRFKYPWEVNQFGFMGTYVYTKLNIRL